MDGWMGGWRTLDWVAVADLLRGNCALSKSGMGRERISRSDVMFHTASLIKWL